jgi:C4-dicarboxylate-specific signal transduction histidine kinase
MRLLHLLEKRPSASLAEVAPTIERMEDRIGEMNESMDAARRFFSQRLEYGGHFRLSEIIERIRTAQAERLKLTGVQLQVRGDIDLMITGSDNLFFNAVNNLVGNAVDALSSSDRSDRVIMISAFKEPGGFKMTLEDNAHGIDPAVLDRLFEPFVTTKDDGSGIGLMLAKNILEEYFGATIAVKSDRNGTGFTMEFDD